MSSEKFTEYLEKARNEQPDEEPVLWDDYLAKKIIDKLEFKGNSLILGVKDGHTFEISAVGNSNVDVFMGRGAKREKLTQVHLDSFVGQQIKEFYIVDEIEIQLKLDKGTQLDIESGAVDQSLSMDKI